MTYIGSFDEMLENENQNKGKNELLLLVINGNGLRPGKIHQSKIFGKPLK